METVNQPVVGIEEGPIERVVRLTDPTTLSQGHRDLWRLVRVVCGIVLIAAGLVGMVLPIIPGLPMVLVGILLVAPDHPWVNLMRERLIRWRGRGSR
jgi:hypothetical protein